MRLELLLWLLLTGYTGAELLYFSSPEEVSTQIVSSSAAIEGVYVGHNVTVALSRDCRLLSLDTNWTFEAPTEHECTTGVGFDGDRIVVGGTSVSDQSTVWLLDSENGNPIGQVNVEGQLSGTPILLDSFLWVTHNVNERGELSVFEGLNRMLNFGDREPYGPLGIVPFPISDRLNDLSGTLLCWALAPTDRTDRRSDQRISCHSSPPSGDPIQIPTTDVFRSVTPPVFYGGLLYWATSQAQYRLWEDGQVEKTPLVRLLSLDGRPREYTTLVQYPPVLDSYRFYGLGMFPPVSWFRSNILLDEAQGLGDLDGTPLSTNLVVNNGKIYVGTAGNDNKAGRLVQFNDNLQVDWFVSADDVFAAGISGTIGVSEEFVYYGTSTGRVVTLRVAETVADIVGGPICKQRNETCGLDICCYPNACQSGVCLPEDGRKDLKKELLDDNRARGQRGNRYLRRLYNV